MPRLLEHFSVWDLMAHKARLTCSDVGGLDMLLHDVSSVLFELRALLEGCLRPVRTRKTLTGRSRGRRPAHSVHLEESLAVAMGLDSGLWKAKEVPQYASQIIGVEHLFLPSGAKREAEEVEETEEEAGDKKEGDAENKESTEEVVVKKRKRGRPPKVKKDEDAGEMEAEGGRPKRQRRKPRKFRDTASMDSKEGLDEMKEEEEEGDGSASSDTYLCLKCGQRLCKAYGKQHEAKCDGFFVRHPEYKKVCSAVRRCRVVLCMYVRIVCAYFFCRFTPFGPQPCR